MESIGNYLKVERESQHLSLKDISESTKIKERLLKAIEEDRYELIASPVYVKGFLEAYARCLGIDPNEIVPFCQKYAEDKNLSKAPESKERITSSRMRKWIPLSKKRITLWALLIPISVIALFIAVLLYYTSFKPI